MSSRQSSLGIWTTPPSSISLRNSEPALSLSLSTKETGPPCMVGGFAWVSCWLCCGGWTSTMGLGDRRGKECGCGGAELNWLDSCGELLKLVKGGLAWAWWKVAGLTGAGGGGGGGGWRGGLTSLFWLKVLPSRERMLLLKELREERKSKALPSFGEDLTLLQLEYWKRAAMMTSLTRVTSLIVIICKMTVSVDSITVWSSLPRPSLVWGCSCTQIRGATSTNTDTNKSGVYHCDTLPVNWPSATPLRSWCHYWSHQCHSSYVAVRVVECNSLW